MATFGFTFDASQVQPGGAMEVLPAGEYPIRIVDSQMEPTKSGSGAFLKLQLEVLDGPHKGAALFDRLNLVNDNPKAVEIAQRTLSAICHAVGVLQVQDSAQLHNRPLLARVAYREGGEPDGKGGTYGPSNEIKAYKPLTGAPAQAAAPAPQQWQAPAKPHPAPAAAPPWQAAAAPAQAAAPAPQPAAATPPWAQRAA